MSLSRNFAFTSTFPELRYPISFKPVLCDDLKPSQREAVRRFASELLDDVGRPDSDFQYAQDKSFQIIRKLTIEEERLVSK